jgi:hypothetical protein
MLGRGLQNVSEHHAAVNLKVGMKMGLIKITDTVDGQVEHTQD